MSSHSPTPSRTAAAHLVNATSSSAPNDLVASRCTSSSSTTDDCESLYLVAQSLLAQVVTLLEDVVVSDQQLTTVSEYVPGSTIGKHLRHLHDHYRLLLDSLLLATPHDPSSSSSSPSPVELSYDVRSRNIASETSHKAALEAFIQLQHRLETETRSGTAIEPDRTIRLEAVTPFKVRVESSWARELWFVSLHATHHLALVRVVATELGLTVRDEFGVAPSTLVARTQKHDDETQTRSEAKDKVEHKIKRDEQKPGRSAKRRESKL
ncbi:BQ5605_C031g10942 [Microbotryum silenes-dioicae]|uniref:BQ5605_C031g10942 protein n=1 Tax=Microbotryum silenes-dioicae TaxID=796604 RepID=A0A2X0ML34_9BASI|nr:BQ5605_C031g10942 [Microbotryum silenes-dioicae]